jgi:hypothetical protein
LNSGITIIWQNFGINLARERQIKADAGFGQWSYEQHLNFKAIGQKQPEFPGEFTSNHSLQGTPEFAYGITNWWKARFYLPFEVSGSG